MEQATAALTAMKKQRHVGAKVLIVAHGGTISILLHFLGMHPGSPANFRIRNTSCSVVDVRVEGGRVEDVTVQSG